MSNTKNNLPGSYTIRILKFFFLSGDEIDLNKTLIVQIFKKIYWPFLTEIFIVVAVLLYWYEEPILQYFPNFPHNWLALGLVVFALLLAKKENLFFYRSQLWFLMFLLLSLISGLLSLWRGLEPRLIFEGWLLLAQFGLVLIAAQTVKNKTFLLKVLVIAAIPIALTGIYQFFVKIPTPKLWLSPGEDLTRVFAFFGSPNVFGVLMAVIGLLSLGLFLKEKNKIWFLISVLNFLALIFSFSRSAWFGALSALLFIMLFYRRRLFYFSPLLLLGLFIPLVRNRIAISFSANYLQDSSLDGRIWAFQNGLHIFQKFPFFGTGPGSYGGKLALNYASPVYLEGIQNGYTALYFTDNQFLEILVQTGLFGLISFMGFLISTVNILVRKALKKDLIALTAGSVLVSFIVAGLFANVLEFGAVSIPVGIILGVALGDDTAQVRSNKAESIK